MFGPDKNSGMYDNPHDVYSSEWKRWNWEAQQKRDAATWENLLGNWPSTFNSTTQTTTPEPKTKATAHQKDNLTDNDKVVFFLAGIAAFFWIIHEIGSANWIAGAIGGFIAGYIAAKTYKIIFILVALYVAAVAFGYSP